MVKESSGFIAILGFNILPYFSCDNGINFGLRSGFFMSLSKGNIGLLIRLNSIRSRS
jgi:hypothetical protein